MGTFTPLEVLSGRSYLLLDKPHPRTISYRDLLSRLIIRRLAILSIGYKVFYWTQRCMVTTQWCICTRLLVVFYQRSMFHVLETQDDTSPLSSDVHPHVLECLQIGKMQICFRTQWKYCLKELEAEHNKMQITKCCLQGMKIKHNFSSADNQKKRQ